MNRFARGKRSFHQYIALFFAFLVFNSSVDVSDYVVYSPHLSKQSQNINEVESFVELLAEHYFQMGADFIPDPEQEGESEHLQKKTKSFCPGFCPVFQALAGISVSPAVFLHFEEPVLWRRSDIDSPPPQA